MSDTPKPIKVTILDNDYLVACKGNEEAELLESVKFLNAKIEQQKLSGNTKGDQNIAVMTALNVVNEHLKLKKKNEQASANRGDNLARIESKIQSVLSRQNLDLFKEAESQ
jgi:cell division protein ZapA